MKITLILVAALLTGISSAGNLIKNGDFTASLTGWSKNSWGQPIGKFTVKDKIMTIDNNAQNQLSLLQQGIKLTPGTTYRLQFKIKGEQIKNGTNKDAGASVMLLSKGKMIWLCSPAGRWKTASGTFDWKECDFSFQLPATADPSVNIYCVLRGASGNASFTDITIEEEKVK